MKISFKGVQFAVGAFLLPFFFVMDPALLGEGSAIEVVWATLRAVLAFSLISVASAGCLAARWTIPAIGYVYYHHPAACAVFDVSKFRSYRWYRYFVLVLVSVVELDSQG